MALSPVTKYKLHLAMSGACKVSASLVKIKELLTRHQNERCPPDGYVKIDRRQDHVSMFKERCQKSKRAAYLVKSIRRCHLDAVDYALRNPLTT